MTESSESSPVSEGASNQRKVRRVVASKSVVIAPQARPVVVRRPAQTRAATANSRDHMQRSAPVIVAKSRESKTRLGEPDFSKNILTGNDSENSRFYRKPSFTQKLFFDAAIAVVTLSFMVLTLLHL